MIFLSDLLINTPRAPTIEEDEDQEESSDRFHKDILDNPHNAADVNTVNEEEELKIEHTPLDQSF